MTGFSGESRLEDGPFHACQLISLGGVSSPCTKLGSLPGGLPLGLCV